MNFKRAIKRLLRRPGCRVRELASRAGYSHDAFAEQRRLIGEDKDIAILDVGAHHGETTKRYRAFFPRATIYAFEPYPESFERLRARLHGMSSVHPVPKAVSEVVGERQLFVNGSVSTNSLFSRPRSGPRYYSTNADTKRSIAVPSTTVDSFMDEVGLSSIGILKLDIQGGEVLALRGAKRALQDQAISLVYAEVFFTPHYTDGAASYLDIATLLFGHGYELFNLYDHHSAENGQLRFSDAIFLSKSLRACAVNSMVRHRD